MAVERFERMEPQPTITKTINDSKLPIGAVELLTEIGNVLSNSGWTKGAVEGWHEKPGQANNFYSYYDNDYSRLFISHNGNYLSFGNDIEGVSFSLFDGIRRRITNINLDRIIHTEDEFNGKKLQLNKYYDEEAINKSLSLINDIRASIPSQAIYR